jgi:hypothetical protein
MDLFFIHGLMNDPAPKVEELEDLVWRAHELCESLNVTTLDCQEVGLYRVSVYKGWFGRMGVEVHQAEVTPRNVKPSGTGKYAKGLAVATTITPPRPVKGYIITHHFMNIIGVTRTIHSPDSIEYEPYIRNGKIILAKS